MRNAILGGLSGSVFVRARTGGHVLRLSVAATIRSFVMYRGGNGHPGFRDPSDAAKRRRSTDGVNAAVW